MLAIQRFAITQGWQVYGFEPANEPNVEWYFNQETEACTAPCYIDPDSWLDMDTYFYAVWSYVQATKGNTPIRVFTPPMAQGANAEMANVMTDPPVQGTCEFYEFSGYELMTQTFDSISAANDGYSWHNYFLQTKEEWDDCPTGMHVSMWFPYQMTYNITYNLRPAFITEADLAPPQFEWNNPILNKDTQYVAAANSIRDFFDYERNSSNGWGARRIAAWLLHDDTGNQQHAWAQAWNDTAFRQWFEEWWYQSEPHLP